MESRIFPTPYSYFEIKRIIRRLCARYPFLEVTTIGKSAAGRDIFSLGIGSETENVLFLGGDDPQSPITTLILLKFCEEICHSILKGKQLCGLDMRKALFGRKITFIPLLNPDGAEIRQNGKCESDYILGGLGLDRNTDYRNWRSNLRGVEICRNFSYGFEQRSKEERLKGIRHPSHKGYSGQKCESEAETIALCRFCRENEINHLIHLSAFGKTVGYSGLEGALSEAVKMSEIIAAVSGYSISPPFGQSDSNICDWFTYEFSRPALCVKVGEEKVPDVNELYPQYSSLREALTLSSLF